MKMRPVEAEMFHADRQTDGQTDRRTERQMKGQKHDKANVRVSKFCESA